MATQQEIEARVEALKAARASGVLRVTYQGRTVEYRSLSEIERAIAVEQAELATLGYRKPVRQIRIYQDGKGL